MTFKHAQDGWNGTTLAVASAEHAVVVQVGGDHHVTSPEAAVKFAGAMIRAAIASADCTGELLTRDKVIECFAEVGLHIKDL